MPKHKTHKGASKRMKLTGRNKVKRTVAGKSHLAAAMSPKRTRNLKGTTMAAPGDAKKYRELLAK